jgi:hypothetical protein
MAESTDESTDSSERMPAADLAAAARDSIQELTGYPAESVTALQWEDDRWHVTVVVCELERVPNTSDVMAAYVVELDQRGGLLGYRRSHRYVRSQAEGG